MVGASGLPFIGIAGIVVQDIVDICKELKLHKVRLWKSTVLGLNIVCAIAKISAVIEQMCTDSESPE